MIHLDLFWSIGQRARVIPDSVEVADTSRITTGARAADRVGISDSTLSRNFSDNINLDLVWGIKRAADVARVGEDVSVAERGTGQEPTSSFIRVEDDVGITDNTHSQHVFTGTHDINRDIDMDVMILDKNSVLRITGRNVSIKANKLITRGERNTRGRIEVVSTGCQGGKGGISTPGSGGRVVYGGEDVSGGTSPRRSGVATPFFGSGGEPSLTQPTTAAACTTFAQALAVANARGTTEFGRLFKDIRGSMGSDGTAAVPSGRGGNAGNQLDLGSRGTTVIFHFPGRGGDGGQGAQGVDGVAGKGALSLDFETIEGGLWVDGSGNDPNPFNSSNGRGQPGGAGNRFASSGFGGADVPASSVWGIGGQGAIIYFRYNRVLNGTIDIDVSGGFYTGSFALSAPETSRGSDGWLFKVGPARSRDDVDIDDSRRLSLTTRLMDRLRIGDLVISAGTTLAFVNEGIRIVENLFSNFSGPAIRAELVSIGEAVVPKLMITRHVADGIRISDAFLTSKVALAFEMIGIAEIIRRVSTHRVSEDVPLSENRHTLKTVFARVSDGMRIAEKAIHLKATYIFEGIGVSEGMKKIITLRMAEPVRVAENFRISSMIKLKEAVRIVEGGLRNRISKFSTRIRRPAIPSHEVRVSVLGDTVNLKSVGPDE